MPFPEHQRTVYDKNPLLEVICQLRFPTILRIGSESPSAFQEKIRSLYPEFGKRVIEFELPPNMAQLLPQSAKNALAASVTEDSYEFATGDSEWIVTLTTRSLSLTCRDYPNWEDFAAHLSLPLQALEKEYSPAYYTRIGLRYQNVIRREEWGLEGVPWEEILNPYLVGVLANPDIKDDRIDVLSQCTVPWSPGNSVRIQYGLVRKLLENQTFDNEASYLVDNDFFTDQKVEIGNGLSTLNTFHDQSGKVFNWCITSAFRSRMGKR